jgi:universal stress protein A
VNKQHVLVAVDTSTESEAVLRKGMDLAQGAGASLSVLHVMELPTPMVGELALIDTYFNYEEFARLTREALLEQLNKVGLEEACLHVLTGAPASTVVHYAEEHEVDLIVCGSHGKNGFKLLLGSVASGILHKAPCDVFVHRITE